MEIDLENLEFGENKLELGSYENENNNDIELKDNEIINPFYIKSGESKLNDIEKKELFTYKKVYILCTRNDFNQDELSISDQELILRVFEKVISKDDFEKLGNFFVLTEASVKILKNKEHYSQSLIVETSKDNILEIFNHNKYKFENFNEIVVFMIELAEHFVNIYKEQYEQKNEEQNLLQTILLDTYYNRDGYNPNYSIINKKIINLKEADFWTQKYNCNYTINEHFLQRKFDYDGKIESHVKAIALASSLEKNQDAQIKQVINKLDKDGVKDVNYLDHIYRKEVYVDAMDALKDNKKRTYFATPNEKIEKGAFNKKSITELFESLDVKLHEKQMYDIFNTLLISKEYCHLVLNNKSVLDKMKPIIDKFYHLYRYLFGYAWMCFYTEECIFKTKTTNENRYVFDIETVHRLPVFPVINKDLHLNPYITSLVSKKVISSENNCLSLPMNFDNFESSYGVCNLEQFKERFNLFTTGDEKKNIFDGIDWSCFAVSGSAIPACMQKKSPLIDLVRQPEQSDADNLKTFYSHYYPDSDIDLMCNKAGVFEFMDKVNDIVNIVNKNIFGTEEIKLIIEPKKSLALIIHQDYIIERISAINKELNKNYSADDIKTNISTQEIKEYFYKIYTTFKFEQNIKQRSKYETNHLYDHFYKVTSIDDMNIYIVDNMYQKDNVEPKDSESYFYVNDYRSEDNKVSKDKNIMIFKISENIKFKLHSSKMLHSIEAFRIKDPSFFSVVARFHLPCVRGFYTGNNIYMLPSCVTAMMTGINIDYKYFAGIRDPIDILNKYRMRGYGILINDNEKQHMVYYNGSLNNKWNNMFNVNLKNKDSINKFFGAQNINSNIFKPLVFLKNFPKDIYNIVNPSRTFNDVNDLVDFLRSKKGYDSSLSLVNTTRLKTINEDGKIEVLKKWIIEGVKD
jgi:hypothetical protein